MSSTKSNIVQCKNEQNKKFFTKRAITFHKNVYVYNDLTTINEPVLSIQWEEHPKLAHWSIKLSNNKPSKPNHISEWKKPVGLMKFKMWNATHVRELEKLVRGKRGGGGGERRKEMKSEKGERTGSHFFSLTRIARWKVASSFSSLHARRRGLVGVSAGNPRMFPQGPNKTQLQTRE